MSSDDKGDQLLQALDREILKVKRIYDGSDRLSIQYEAFANTADGGACLRTDYTYVGASDRIDKMRESTDVWLAAYDI